MLRRIGEAGETLVMTGWTGPYEQLSEEVRDLDRHGLVSISISDEATTYKLTSKGKALLVEGP